MRSSVLAAASRAVFNRGGVVRGFNPLEMFGIFKVSVTILHTKVQKLFYSLWSQIICTSSFKFVPPSLFAFIV